jgi:hypothetical protein
MEHDEPKITLRDYYIGQALAGLTMKISQDVGYELYLEDNITTCARIAIALADKVMEMK